jgi:hypothetical protein
MGARGFADGLQSGCVIGLPPVLNFGSKALQDKIVPKVLVCWARRGRPRLADGRCRRARRTSPSLSRSRTPARMLLVYARRPSSPNAASSISSTARKSVFVAFVLSASKDRVRWITGGFWSDYFSVACRTGKNKLTMLLIERDDNVDTKKIHTSYSKSAGTSYITFDNVKVPVENILGKEGQGLQVVVSRYLAATMHAKSVQLSNFNRMRPRSAGNSFLSFTDERWVMCCASIRSTRYFLEQTFIWAK